jgi:hypothetical protein
MYATVLPPWGHAQYHTNISGEYLGVICSIHLMMIGLPSERHLAIETQYTQ